MLDAFATTGTSPTLPRHFGSLAASPGAVPDHG
jgi:hypothetical protein